MILVKCVLDTFFWIGLLHDLDVGVEGRLNVGGVWR